ncbi:MAG: hypothetical protein AB7R69_00955 [Candidatus Babeliales bacterium]
MNTIRYFSLIAVAALAMGPICAKPNYAPVGTFSQYLENLKAQAAEQYKMDQEKHFGTKFVIPAETPKKSNWSYTAVPAKTAQASVSLPKKLSNWFSFGEVKPEATTQAIEPEFIAGSTEHQLGHVVETTTEQSTSNQQVNTITSNFKNKGYEIVKLSLEAIQEHPYLTGVVAVAVAAGVVEYCVYNNGHIKKAADVVKNGIISVKDGILTFCKNENTVVTTTALAYGSLLTWASRHNPDSLARCINLKQNLASAKTGLTYLWQNASWNNASALATKLSTPALNFVSCHPYAVAAAVATPLIGYGLYKTYQWWKKPVMQEEKGIYVSTQQVEKQVEHEEPSAYAYLMNKEKEENKTTTPSSLVTLEETKKALAGYTNTQDMKVQAALTWEEKMKLQEENDPEWHKHLTEKIARKNMYKSLLNQ